MPYAEIEIHGTPAGYRAGCKTDQMCADSVPWSCKRAYERYKGDYAFHRRIDQGLDPWKIHELEAQETEAWAEKPVAPAKPVKKKPKRAALVDEPDRLTAYGANAAAAKQRMTAAKDAVSIDVPVTVNIPATSAAALAVVTPSKENPMSEILPAGLEWKQPPAAVVAKALGAGGRSKNLAAIELAKSKPGQWLLLGQQPPSAATRWRKGEVVGTMPGDFEAVIDTGARKGKGSKGDLYVRFVGKPTPSTAAPPPSAAAHTPSTTS